MKQLYRLAANISGYGFVLNQFTVQCLEYTSQKREIYACCWEIYLISSIKVWKTYCIYTDGGTWYNEACNVLRLKHYLHSPFQKNLIERVNQYLKDRIESFDDYYPYMQKKRNVIYFMYITGYNSLFLYV